MSSVVHISPVEELATFLARGPSPSEIADFRLSKAALRRVRALMDKNKSGTLTADEGYELDRLILLDDVIGLIQSRVPTSTTRNQANPQDDKREASSDLTSTTGA